MYGILLWVISVLCNLIRYIVNGNNPIKQNKPNKNQEA